MKICVWPVYLVPEEARRVYRILEMELEVLGVEPGSSGKAVGEPSEGLSHLPPVLKYLLICLRQCRAVYGLPALYMCAGALPLSYASRTPASCLLWSQSPGQGAGFYYYFYFSCY